MPIPRSMLIQQRESENKPRNTIWGDIQYAFSHCFRLSSTWNALIYVSFEEKGGREGRAAFLAMAVRIHVNAIKGYPSQSVSTPECNIPAFGNEYVF